LDQQEKNKLLYKMRTKSLVSLKDSWKSYLKSKSLDKLLDLYDKDCLFKGTLSDKTVIGKEGLEKYFVNFVKNIHSVRFLKENKSIVKNDLVIESGKYNFYSGGKILNASYQFVVDGKKNKIVSHYSSLIK